VVASEGVGWRDTRIIGTCWLFIADRTAAAGEQKTSRFCEAAETAKVAKAANKN
jgi:hypothetical protein